METADYEEVTKVDLVEPFIVASKKYFNDFETYDAEIKDLCNTYTHLNIL